MARKPRRQGIWEARASASTDTPAPAAPKNSTLTLSVPEAWKRRFKAYCASKGLEVSEVLMAEGSRVMGGFYMATKTATAKGAAGEEQRPAREASGEGPDTVPIREAS